VNDVGAVVVVVETDVVDVVVATVVVVELLGPLVSFLVQAAAPAAIRRVTVRMVCFIKRLRQRGPAIIPPTPEGVQRSLVRVGVKFPL